MGPSYFVIFFSLNKNYACPSPSKCQKAKDSKSVLFEIYLLLSCQKDARAKDNQPFVLAGSTCLATYKGEHAKVQ